MKDKFIDKMNCPCNGVRANAVHFWGFGKSGVGGCMTFQATPLTNALVNVTGEIGTELGISSFWRG